jgi:sigma-E factor negative regulatory protein RseC
VLLGDWSASDFAIDEEVDISIPEQVLVAAALLVYLLPLITLLAGMLLVSQWWSGDLPAFIGAVAGFAIGIAVVKCHAIMHRNDANLQPLIIGKKSMPKSACVQIVEAGCS